MTTQRPALVAAFGLLAALLPLGNAWSEPFEMPVACKLGKDCFIQQFADTQPGTGSQDPFCGSATYDGHDGTDFRILSMSDVERGVDVLAMADGLVVRTRSSEPDHLVKTKADQAAVTGRECGNGLVMMQADGFEVQYCHLKRDSLLVAPGDRVKQGQRLGKVGASGLAQFPHVHVTVRRQGDIIEPVTGRPLDLGCRSSQDGSAASLFAGDVLAAIGKGLPQLLASGVADGVVEERQLETRGPASTVHSGAAAVVGWGWLINLAKGDELTVRLFSPDGTLFAEQIVPPLERSKATYVAYAGRKRQPVAGSYKVEVIVKRESEVVLRSANDVAVQ